MNTIQIILKERRKELKLTQKDIANKLGITQQAYQQIESGGKDIRVSTLTNLCEILEVSADELLGIKKVKFVEPAGEWKDIRKEASKAVARATRKSGMRFSAKPAAAKVKEKF